MAQVANDVATAYAGFKANRELVERMEGTLLGRARTARDIVERQYRAGAASLMDFLDAGADVYIGEPRVPAGSHGLLDGALPA